MLNGIEVKADNMNVTVSQLFNNMTDQDFLYLHSKGQLKNFCYALSVDLNTKPQSNEAEC
jgi:hypothetical protein